ncbi:MAG: NAD(P)/FAD-dependent oxidoreductase [Pseudomonadota bacterium]
MNDIAEKQKRKKNMVIIGGGFAGTVLARKLERKLPPEWRIYLLSKTNFVTFNPLLPEVVGASVLPGHVQAPIRQMIKRTRIRMVTVDRIDFENKTVHYHNEEQGELKFDQLVFSSGVAANMNMIDGMKEHALPLKTVGDALQIRKQVIERLEQASIHPNLERRKELTKFIIIGGRFSGVEVAGEIEDFLSSAQRFYKGVKKEDCKVIILHGTDCLLPEISKKLGKKTERIFEQRNIDVRLNARATKIEKEKVILSDGEEVHAATIVCTIGTSPHAYNQIDVLPLERGKIVTEPDMSVKNLKGIWALGDCALVPNATDGRYCPPTAQFADRQARVLAKNILASLQNKNTQPFSYEPIGMMASIGHNNAVVELVGLRLSGILAFMLWRGAYLLKIPTFSRKARLFLEWNWAMFFPPDIAHMGFKRTGEED